MRSRWFNLFVLAVLLLGVLPVTTQAAPVEETSIQAEPEALPVIFESDFEGDNGGLVGTNDWEWGSFSWAGTCGTSYPPSSAHSGSSMWGQVLNDCYNNIGGTSILSFDVDLTEAQSVATLSFWDWYDVYESFDHGEVYVNGTQVLDRASSYTTPSSWEEQIIDLTPYIGGVATIEFRVYATTVVERAGWYIDDVKVVGDIITVGLIFEPDAQEDHACPGVDVGYTVSLSNTSGITDTFDLMVDSAWPTVVDPATLYLMDGEEGSVAVTVTIPTYVFNGEIGEATLWAGAQTSSTISTTASLHTMAGNMWEMAESGGDPALWPAFASDGDAIYYFDGLDDDGDATDQTQIYDPATGWDWGMGHGYGSFYGGVAGYDAGTGKIYYAPGFVDGMTAVDAFVVYDPVTDEFTNTVAQRPEALGLGAGGVTDDGVFVWAGGSSSMGLLGHTPVYTYDIASDMWYTGATLNAVGFTAAGYAVVEDKLYVGGNYFGSAMFYVYDVSTDTWTQLADLPESLVVAGTQALSPLFIEADGYIYVIGGGFSPNSAGYDTWIYDPVADDWTFFGALNVNTLGSGGGVIDGVLYTFGGGKDTLEATASAPHEMNALVCPYPALADVTGQVTNGLTGLPIEGAAIAAQGLRGLTGPSMPLPYASTDANGDYTLSLVPAVYEITASYGDYKPVTEIVTVTSGGVTQDFVLGLAIVNADPAAFDEMVYYNNQVTRTLYVTNTGVSDLDLAITEINGGFAPTFLDMATRVPNAVVADSKADALAIMSANEMAPSSLTYPAPLAMGDELVRVDIETPTGDTQILGLEFALDHFWATGGASGGDPNKLYKLDKTGTLVATYDQSSSAGWGWRDLAFDGTYLYGSDSNVLVQIDPSTGQATGTTVPCPESVCRALAYDPATDHFWTANFSNSIYEFDRSGTVINTYANSLSAYGMAWDQYSPGGPFLWVWSQDGTSPNLVQATQIDPDTGSATGVAFQGSIISTGDNIAGGATISPHFVPGQLTFIGMHQASPDTAVVYDLDVAVSAGVPIPWLTETPTATTVMPGDAEMVALVFDAAQVNAFGVYTGDLLLEGGQMPVTVPVQMTVADNFMVAPDALEATVDWGDTDFDLVDLTNYGAADVDYKVELPLYDALLEDFEGDFPPDGWTVLNNGSDCVWESTATTGRTNSAGTGEAADADSDWCGSGVSNMDTELWSPAIDLTGASLAELTFNSYFYDASWNANDYGYVDISTNGGSSWTTILAYDANTSVGPKMESVDLSAYTGNVVHLRFHYGTDGWDWYWLVDDVTISADIPWLGINSITGTVDASEVVTYTYDAAQVPQPGDYTAMTYVTSDDILEDRPVSVTLHVVASADAARIEGTVTGNRTIDGDGMPLEDVAVTIEGPYPASLATDVDGAYGWWVMPSMTGTYTVTYELDMYLPYSEVVTLDNGETLVNDVELILDSAYINANPESLTDSLAWGASATHPVLLSNPDPAEQPLSVSVSELGGTYTPLDVQTVRVEIPAVLSVSSPPAGTQTMAAASTRPARTVEFELNSLALGKIKVLILTTDVAQSDLGGMDEILMAYPDLDVYVYPLDDEPTLDELLEYDVVIVGGQTTWEPTHDHNLVGDVLADYVDMGKGVVQVFGTMHGAPSSGGFYWGLGGRWESEKYSPMTYSSNYVLGEDRTLGIYAANHPLMQSVSSIEDHFIYGMDVSARVDAEMVAYYDNGVPYLTAYPGSIVAINQVIFNAADWSGDVPTLLHNAILYVAPTDIPWLSEDATEFDIAVDGSSTMNVTLDASAVSQPGTYNAWLWLENTDVLQQGAYIPVEMQVQPDATMSLLVGTVSSDRMPDPMEGASVMMDMPSGMMTMTTDVNGEFYHWFSGSDAGAYDLMGYMPGYLSSTMSVDIVSGMTTTVDMELKMDAPWLQYTADPMSVVLLPGEQATRTLSLENFGQQDLSYRFMELPALPSIARDFGPVSVTWVDGAFTVDAEVAAELDAGSTADFFIWMRERADLSPAYRMTNVDDRRQFVFDALTSTADRSQAEVIAYLESRNLDYSSFWINNSILVHGGDQGVIDAMAARDDVLRIRGVYTQMYIPDAEQLSIVTLDESSPSADPTWNIDIVDAPEVWSQLGVTGNGVVVANIDTGVRYTHNALVDSYRGNLGAGSFEHNYNWGSIYGNGPTACTGSPLAPCDWNGHGSHTMGTMIGGDGDGPFDMDIGMAPDAQWIACMGCDSPPNGCSDAALTGCAQWMVAPLDLAGANPDPTMAPDVVNNSWGGGGEDNWYYSYVEAWNAANIIPVFSAGNAGPGCSTLGSPGSYDNVIGVGGTDNADNNYSSSSRGPGSGSGVFPVQKPDIAAPGEGVPSSVATGDDAYSSYNGTSMASPHVSGLVALLRSIDPSIDRQGIWDLITTNAVTDLTIKNGSWCGAGPDFPNYVFGYGRIDAFETVKAARVLLDIPWLSETPITGTIVPQDSGDASVVFDATGMMPGVYTGTLMLDHNDPMVDIVEMVVQMTVVSDTGVMLEPAMASLEGDADTTVTYTLQITNTGATSDTFGFSLEGNAWTTTVMPDSVELDSMGTAMVDVSVTIADAATLEISACDVVTVSVMGQSSMAWDYSVLTTCGITARELYLPIVMRGTPQNPDF